MIKSDQVPRRIARAQNIRFDLIDSGELTAVNAVIEENSADKGRVIR